MILCVCEGGGVCMMTCGCIGLSDVLGYGAHGALHVSVPYMCVCAYEDEGK